VVPSYRRAENFTHPIKHDLGCVLPSPGADLLKRGSRGARQRLQHRMITKFSNRELIRSVTESTWPGASSSQGDYSVGETTVVTES
jgi:hypothetical protein